MDEHTGGDSNSSSTDHARSDVHANTTTCNIQCLLETVGHDLHALGFPIFFVPMNQVQPHQTRKSCVRVFLFLRSTHRDLRDVPAGLLSRVKLSNCVLLSSASPRCDGQSQLEPPSNSHGAVTDSPNLSSSPQVMLVRTFAMLLAPSVGKIGVKPKKSLSTVPWNIRLGSDWSQYSRGETKSQMHRANTRRERCIAMSCVMTAASRECAVGVYRTPRASVPVLKLPNASPWCRSLAQKGLQL